MEQNPRRDCVLTAWLVELVQNTSSTQTYMLLSYALSSASIRYRDSDEQVLSVVSGPETADRTQVDEKQLAIEIGFPVQVQLSPLI
jgi:hypothetical protein